MARRSVKAGALQTARLMELLVPRYFFDIVDDDRLVSDPDGTALPDLSAARVEATRTIAELALELVPGTTEKQIGISVRDDFGVCLELELTFRLTKYGR